MQPVPALLRSVVLVCAASAGVPLFAGHVARAEPRDDSRAAFLRGVSEAHQDHFTAARDAFLEAYRLFPHPSILMNLGIARMRTGEYLAAEENLSRFLTDDGGAPQEDLVNARSALQVVRQHIGTLRVRVSPGGARATLDGVPLALTPSAFVDIRAVVGPAELRVDAEGYAPSARQVVVEHESPAEADVTLLPLEPGRGVGAREPAPVVGWTLAAAAVAAAAVGTVAGLEAIGLAHDYDTPGAAGYQDHSTRERGVAWRTSADALFAAAILAGGAGAYLIVRPRPRGPDVRAFFGPTSAHAIVRF